MTSNQFNVGNENYLADKKYQRKNKIQLLNNYVSLIKFKYIIN